MALPSIPTCPPARLTAGDSATWDDPGFTHPEYGSFTSTDGWVLTYELIGRASKVSPTSAAEGSGWRTSLTAAQSTELKDPAESGHEPETVRWVARVALGVEVVTVAQGIIQLLPDPATLDAGYESEAEVELRAAKAARSAGITAYSIGTRSVTYATAGELNKRIALLTYQVWQEQHPGELAPQIHGRFVEAR